MTNENFRDMMHGIIDNLRREHIMKIKATASIVAYGCPNCKYIMSRWTEDWYDMEEEFIETFPETHIRCSNCGDATKILKEWIPIKK